jgi:hypothetical protein
MIKAPFQLLAQTGIAVAVAAAILGVSASPASAFSSPEMPGKVSGAGLNRPSLDEPVETRIEQAIDEVDQEGQNALEELGELDTPEKINRAEEILQQMQRTSYEIRKRAHDRTEDRFDELNDLAIGRGGDQARAELRDVGLVNTPEKQARTEAIRTRNALIKARLEERREDQRQRMAQRRDQQALPRADFRLPNGRPPIFAAAHGLRLGPETLTEEQADEAITQLERDGQHALERLGKLDTPGKVQRARKIRAALAGRRQDLHQRAARQNMDAAGDQGMGRDMDQLEGRYQERAHELQQRAEAAIYGLGELDTPEKQEQARQIKVKLEEALAALEERLSNGSVGVIDESLDRETQSLRRRAEAALAELGELDTPERQEKARRIKDRLEAQVRQLREQLARRSVGAISNEGLDRDYDNLRRESAVALKELGRLDTPEKVRQARLIRVRIADAINRLRNQRARQLNDNSGPGPDALTDFLENRGPGGAAGPLDGNGPADRRDRAEPDRQAQEKARAALREKRDTLNRINDRLRAEGDGEVKPTVTPEPTKVEPAREAEPAGNDSTSDSDSSGSNR